ncbi:acyl-CoA thioesterase II [Bermanella sp. 47_1433_sub80_T6]|nr:acyl-CoA thioesterase II [Bermanella sp. 47_1433_sub80_T6]
MNPVTQSLIDLLSVKLLHTAPATSLFRGECEDLGFPNLFGGQILGQSLNAAMQTVPEGFLPHSLHAYFLLAGKVNGHVDYKVEVLRKGRSFAAVRVDAIQDGEIILTQNTSFQMPEEGFEHQNPMPEVKGPEGIMSQLEITRKFAAMIPDKLREKFTADKPLETRPIDPINVFMPDKKDPQKDVWFKPVNDWSQQDLALHYSLMAYSSDFHLLGTSLLPHGLSFSTKGLQLASLDHAIWFHHQPRIDDWMLYSMQSPKATGGRGLNFGHVYNSDGQLMMSTAQEGLMRVRKKAK